jgi:hypothetical protein
LIDIGLTIFITSTWIALVGWVVTDAPLLAHLEEKFRWFSSTETLFSDDYLGIRIIFATSFTTSAWLWLHGLSQLTIRALSGTGALMGYLNVENRPVRTIGNVVNVYLAVLFLMLLLVAAIS